MRCLWYGVLENLKRIPKVPGSRPFGEKSAVRIDDNGLRIFYKKDTLILLFTIVIIIFVDYQNKCQKYELNEEYV